ncbi:MAG: dihydroxy-acid dehydratase [Nitrospira sp.]|nr:dihydroxy-acid dehydratase [Nitrospira sp.]
MVVIRYEGPSGGPGMREMLGSPSIAGAGLSDSVARLLMDGSRSHGWPNGGYVAPKPSRAVRSRR